MVEVVGVDPQWDEPEGRELPWAATVVLDAEGLRLLDHQPLPIRHPLGV
jgi:hypothetical protein